MKIMKIAILILFFCGALVFQLFPANDFINGAAGVRATRDELSDTIWNIKDTIYALEFDNSGNVDFLEYNTRTDDFDLIISGTYRVRGNSVTLTFAGNSGRATISGRRRNVMSGKIYVDGEVFNITAIRAGK